MILVHRVIPHSLAENAQNDGFSFAAEPLCGPGYNSFPSFVCFDSLLFRLPIAWSSSYTVCVCVCITLSSAGVWSHWKCNMASISTHYSLIHFTLLLQLHETVNESKPRLLRLRQTIGPIESGIQMICFEENVGPWLGVSCWEWT